jgi:cobaltochelatase CobS
LEIITPDKPETVKIEGAHPVLEKLVTALSVGYHVYLYGPAGSGKTTLAQQAATALQRTFFHTGALLQKYELLGFLDANGNYRETAFYKAFKHGGIFLFDELDSSHPQAVIAFNQALANSEITFPDSPEPVKAHPDFVAIAAANTNGQGATAQYQRNKLDAATLDRFVKFTVDYDTALEERLARAEYARLGGTDAEILARWLLRVAQIRGQANSLKLNALISPRTSIRGAGLLAAGFTESETLAATITAQLSDDQINQLGLAV